MSRFFRLAVVLALFVASGCSSSPAVLPLAIGSQVDFNLLEDQRGNPFTHQDAMTTVLFVDSMKGNSLIRDTLKDVDVTCMSEGRVVYLADISGMPSLISTLIAVPRMRDYPYPVWLDRNGLATAALPVQEDAVTVLTLKQSAIVAVDHLREPAQLFQRLLKECGPAPQQVAAVEGDQ
jgi:hypothetical protein